MLGVLWKRIFSSMGDQSPRFPGDGPGTGVARRRRAGRAAGESSTVPRVTDERLREFERTAGLYRESLDLLRKMGVEASIADVQFNLARLAHAHGYVDLAEQLYRKCLPVFADQGNMARVAECESSLATLDLPSEPVNS